MDNCHKKLFAVIEDGFQRYHNGIYQDYSFTLEFVASLTNRIPYGLTHEDQIKDIVFGINFHLDAEIQKSLIYQQIRKKIYPTQDISEIDRVFMDNPRPRCSKVMRIENIRLPKQPEHTGGIRKQKDGQVCGSLRRRGCPMLAVKPQKLFKQQEELKNKKENVHECEEEQKPKK